MTTRYVPKYFTPIGASVMLIAKPMRQRNSPENRKGERSLTLSDHIDQANTITTTREGIGNVRCKWSDKWFASTYSRRCKEER